MKKKVLHFLGSAAVFLVYLLLGAALGFFIAETVDSSLPELSTGISLMVYGLLMLALLPIGMLHIIAHEAGHMVCALRSGYGFCSFRIMSWIWQKGADGNIRRSRLSLAGTGGQCLMTPPDWTEEGVPFLLYNLGGVLANLLLAGLSALAAYLTQGVAYILCMESVLLGLFFAVTNGLPIPGGAVSNDGSNILALRRSRAAQRAFWVQMKVNEQLSRGLRLRDMPEEWFALPPEAEMDNPLVCTVAVFSANRRMDALELSAAEEEIRALLTRKKGLVPLYRALLTMDGACCELIAGHSGSMTAALRDKPVQQVMKSMKTYPSVLRTRYVAALMEEKNADKAAAALAEFDRCAPRHPNPQEIESERELIALAQEAAHA